ncbi:hypothetical protein AAG587_08265 [Vreelandella neptunia]|uniref:hypothetical protein n=1 Tax=Vreelandella neptunia TaxID=115551 RepID=UPI00315A7B3B
MSRDIYTDPREGDRVQFTVHGEKQPQAPVIVTQVNERGVSFIRTDKGGFSFSSWELWQSKEHKTQTLLSGPVQVIGGGVA